jgi:hypothetical protein
MAIDLLADEPIDLLADEPHQDASKKEFDDLSPEDQEKVMELARQKISKDHPNLPDWLRDLMLKITPKDKSPMLESAANDISAVTNKIPVAAGGLLQGASLPIRGVAGLIPTEFTQRLANSPDLSNIIRQPETEGDQYFNMTGQLVGGGGLLGKMMQGLKGGAALAHIPKALQNPLALAGTGALATQGGIKERALGAGGALALGGAGNLAGKAAGKVGEKLPAFLRGLSNKSTPEALVEAIQKPHDKLQSTADELFGQVRWAMKKRDIKIPVRDEHLEQVTEILPKTRASRKLIDAAKSGDYEAVHKLQSHLYKKGTKGLASDDIALENQGEEILDLRDKINDDLEKHLLKEGHIDVAHVLKQGKKAHKQIMDTYYAPNLRKGIGKMVQSDLRLVPEKPQDLLNQNSVPMKDFLGKHKEAAKHAQGIKEKEAALKALKNIFIGTGVAGGVGTGGKLLYDLFK